MRKWILVCMAVALLFCGLWLYEKYDRSDEETRCQAYAAAASESFRAFSASEALDGEPLMGNYRHGVSQFYAFMDSLRLLPGDWKTEEVYEDCLVVYDHLILDPEEVQEHLDEFLTVMELLGRDYTGDEARQKLNDLSYHFQYVW